MGVSFSGGTSPLTIHSAGRLSRGWAWIEGHLKDTHNSFYKTQGSSHHGCLPAATGPLEVNGGTPGGVEWHRAEGWDAGFIPGPRSPLESPGWVGMALGWPRGDLTFRPALLGELGQPPIWT